MKRISIVFCCLFLVVSVISYSQSFIEQGSSFFNRVNYSSVSWGDCNNDGLLDVLLTGYSATEGFVCKIYKNDGGGYFSQLPNSMPGIQRGTAEWGDYNNDGYLDIVLTGSSSLGYPISKVYKNENGNFFSEQTHIEMVGLEYGDAAWGDYDNDGDLDILICGRDDFGVRHTKIYKNNGLESQGFTEQLNVELPNVHYGTVDWVDFDNDGDLDVFITGGGIEGYHANLFENLGANNFVETGMVFPSVISGSVDWGDYNNDGYADLLITGNNYQNHMTAIYKNNAGMGFSKLESVYLHQVMFGSAVWGDCNNDGLLDILLTGQDNTNAKVAKIYQNQGGGNFAERFDIMLEKVGFGAVAWGDYDNDKNLDIILTGTNDIGDRVTKIYRNYGASSNSKPNEPGNLQATINGNSVLFTWDDAFDFETPVSGLTYNVCVGNSSRGVQVLSPMANPFNGKRRIVANGNAGFSNQLQIDHLETGNYYWSVQTIDNGYEGSNFSFERMFTISNCDLPIVDNQSSAIDAFENDSIQLFCQASGVEPLYYQWYKDGAIITDDLFVQGSNTAILNLNSLSVASSGDYYCRVSNVCGAANSGVTALNVIQPLFESQNTFLLPNINNGAVKWGDYDGDGDLDVLITGYSSTEGYVSKVYRNEMPLFTGFTEQTDVFLTGVYNSAADWGDYDNDGDLDIILSGYSYDGYVTKIYKNEYPNPGVFYENSSTFIPGVRYGSVEWGDHNNDGDLDILIAGRAGNGEYITKLFNNNGDDTFSELTDLKLTGVINGSASWADYNNDGFLDILVSGYSNDGYVSKIYKNAGNSTFTEQTSINLTGVNYSATAWADYNNDGYLDLLLTGYINYTTYACKIYKNNGDESFSEQTDIVIDPVSRGDVAWGDCNNDGFSDILLTGENENGDHISKIYINNGDNTFTEQLNTSLQDLAFSSVAWGDYDNDGSLDVILTGNDNDNISFTRIYRNTNSIANTLPTVPNNLNSNIATNSVTLSWDKATDNETFQDGLSYNIYIGSTPGGNEVLSAMANKPNGKLQKIYIGNAGKNNTITIKNLASGTYYWSVQSIDKSFGSSAFANEQIFSVVTCVTPNITKNPDSQSVFEGDSVQLFCNATGVEPFTYAWYKNSAPLFDNGTISGSNTKVLTLRQLNDLSVGDYHCEVTNVCGTVNSLTATLDVFKPPFAEQTGVNLTGVYNSSAAWGDYDGDGDLDILLSGYNYGPKSYIYDNEGDSVFVRRSDTTLTAVAYSSAAWGDYDNDGDLDILLTGRDIASQFISKVYAYNGVTFIEQTQIVLTGVYNGSVAWADYDNDGDLDILLTGRSKDGVVSKIYKNNGDNTFTDQLSIALIGVEYGSVAWGDYDNDGDQDILLTGKDANYDPVTKVYRNNGNNSFVEEAGIYLTRIMNSSVAWGDYNDDGFLDILLTGQDANGDHITKIYRNSGNSAFEELPTNMFEGIINGAVAWGDYDNDGDLDILLSGRGSNYKNITKVYNNIGNDVFEEQPNITIDAVQYGSVAWGDFNNDMKLDVLLTGRDETGTVVSKIFSNNAQVDNTPPQAPTNLSSSVQNNNVTLSWSPSSDQETDMYGLSYNLYIGLVSGGSEVVSSMASTINGKRMIVYSGNAGNNTSHIIKNLEVGTYYWSVQAVDHAFEGSNFATEKMFTIAECSIIEITKQPESATVYENDSVQIFCEASGVEPIAYQWIKDGTTVYNSSAISGANTGILKITNLSSSNSGTYYCVDSNACGIVLSKAITLSVIKRPFTEQASAVIEGMRYSDAQWADFDNDGYLDIVISGDGTLGKATKVYTNSGFKTFTERLDINLPDMYNGSVSCADYDNDGYVDILLTGLKVGVNSGPKAKLFRNTMPDSLDFAEQMDANLTGVQYSTSDWGDYDNDGDYDILLCGRDENNDRVSKVCKNNGDHTFTEQKQIVLAGVYLGSSSWGDYDNDGDLDILLAGSGTNKTHIYRNNNDNTFTDLVDVNLAYSIYSSVAWGDYDNDGDLDIILVGKTYSSAVIAKVYKNNFPDDQVFIEQISIALEGVSDGSVAWGDYDNNGYLDIILSGINANNQIVTHIYKNNGTESGRFTELKGVEVVKLKQGTTVWGDYDNDGDLDFLISGYDNTNTKVSKIYNNNSNVANNAPSAPTDLVSYVQNNSVVLNWSKPNDNETAQSALTYNYYIGTSQASVDEASPMAKISNGKRLITEFGNAGFKNICKIENLAAGYYYWGVQAIDNAFEGSLFSAEKNFTITACEQPSIEVHPESKTVFVNASVEFYCLGIGIEPFAYQWYKNGVLLSNNDTIIGVTTKKLKLTNLGITSSGEYYCEVSNACGLVRTDTAELIVLQPLFIEQDTVLFDGVYLSSIDWGDMNNDNLLDVVITGRNASNQTICKIYKNNGNNSFTELSGSVLDGVYYSAVAWGDYNNDSFLDLVVSGYNSSYSYSTKVYKNNGDETFSEQTQIEIEPIRSGSLAWGDYDNDGDPDLLMAGLNSDYKPTSKIYKNNGDDTFTEHSSINLVGVSYSSVSWIDYDNDSDLDIFITGRDQNYAPVAYFYKNNRPDSTGFTLQPDIDIKGVFNGSVAWADYNNDGYSDLLLSGQGNAGKIAVVYQNKGMVSSGFSEQTSIVLDGTSSCSAIWGDYDNDGDLDIVLAGVDSDNNKVINAYKSSGGSTPQFTQHYPINIEGVVNCDIAWADYDNDDDIDVLVTGYDSENKRVAKLYRNQSATPNSKPIAPTNLQSQVQNNSVTLSWNKASDSETVSNALTYNVYIGLSMGGDEVLSSMSNTGDGNRKIVYTGNCGHANSYTIENLATGTYYWSVQTIDNSYAGSSFATEQSFNITYCGTSEITQQPQSKTVVELNSDELICVANGIEPITYQWYKDGVLLTDDANINGTATPTLKIIDTPFDKAGGYTCTVDNICGSVVSDTAYLNVKEREFIERTDISLIGVNESSVAWGDYDNDGDLDILLSGYSESGIGVTKIYKNTEPDSTGFAELTSVALTGVYRSSVAWGDYDNDGDLDILIAGKASFGLVSEVYKNNEPDSAGFSKQTDIALQPIGDGSVVWSDFDNDGDVDILLAGYDESYDPVTKVYFNSGDNNRRYIEQTEIALPDVSYCSVKSFDYNNDGYQDLIIAGYAGNDIIKIFKNDATGLISFTEQTHINFKELYEIKLDCGDYDNDGYIDILLSGEDNSGDQQVIVYKNNGNNTFTEQTSIGFIEVSYGSVAWGDYNNDGFFDILLTGYNNNLSVISRIYKNNKDNTFSEQSEINLIGVDNGSVVWGDMDGDNDLDILLTGSDKNGNKVCKIYENNSDSINTVPSKPSNLVIDIQGSSVTFGWNKATDNQTSQSGLTYNVFVGTSSGGAEILSPLSNTSNGILKIAARGNVGQNTAFAINDLVSGTYYWGVQAIDNSFKASEFSAENTFTITNCEVPSIQVEPEPQTAIESSSIEFNCQAKGPEPFTYKWYKNGTLLSDNGSVSGSQTSQLKISGLTFENSGDYSCFVLNACGTKQSIEARLTVVDNPFVLQNIVLDGQCYNTGIWGDADNDGDLDLVLSGTFFINNGDNTFTKKTDVLLPGLYPYSCAWSDYNNDGYLDIILSGSILSSGGTKISRIYENNGNNSFTEQSELTIADLSNGSVDWGDYDNDGDLDVLVTGENRNGISVSKIYENINGSLLSDIGADIPQIKDGEGLWCDYDNDNDLDILFTGTNYSGNYFTEIYKNTSKGVYEPINAGLERLLESSAAWGDYDNDGDADIILMGEKPDGGLFTALYRNDGNDIFSYIDAGLKTLSNATASWGDYDNDGDLDILLVGVENNNEFSIIYNNQGNGVFSNINSDINNVAYVSGVWGDYNGDGNLDVIMSKSNNTSDVYKNNLNSGVMTSFVPQNLQTTFSEGKVIFSWDQPTANATLSSNLTYNLRIGSTSFGYQVTAPHSNVLNGKRTIFETGNAGYDTTYTLLNLKPGTYYWSVQSINQNYCGSEFAPEQTFTISTPFIDINANLKNGTHSKWGDYDNDGDLDVLSVNISGYSSSNKIYKNQGNGIFTELNAVFVNTYNGAADWLDFDNDNDLDFIITGDAATGQQKLTKLFKNEGNGAFSEMSTILTGVEYSAVDCGDYNNDGKVDILLCGLSETGVITKIYRNDGQGVFTDIGDVIVGIWQGDIAWGDYDNDGDLDIAICGKSNLGIVSEIYRNDGNDEFTKLNTSLIGLLNGSVEWGDYDNDHDLDILLTGEDSKGNKNTMLYNNNGAGGFVAVNTSLQGVGYGDGSWGDYDNDGDLDIILAGLSSSEIATIYRNEGNGVFIEIASDFEGDNSCSAAWGDYDGDYDLDLLISGDTYCKIYKNNTYFANTPPQSPENLSYTYYEYGVSLEWDKSSDVQSGDALYYNLRMDSISGGFGHISPLSNSLTGKRLVPEIGNMQTNNSWVNDSLPVGTYYWSVQAIDQGYVGSAWSAEESFTITVIRADFENDTVCLRDTTHFTDLTLTGDITLTGWLWEFGDGKTSTLQNPEHVYQNAGTYTVKLTSYGGAFSNSIEKTVEVKGAPVAQFVADEVCLGTATNFTNSSVTNGLTITDWYWDLGDGSNSIEETAFTHNYSAGTFNVELFVTASNLCNDSITKQVSVGVYPNATISLNGNTQFCKGDSTLMFVEHNNTYNYTWKLNSVAVSGAVSDSLVVHANSGDYTVEIVNPIGTCLSTSSIVPITIWPTPAAPFINFFGDTVFCQGNELDLSVSNNADYTYQWKFNAGAVGTDTSVLSASNTGVYSLQVQNSNGCASESLNEVNVTVHSLPAVPSINKSGPTTFCQGQSVTLSVDNNPQLTYQWKNDFGNVVGETSSQLVVTSSGNYYLQVLNANNCSVESEVVAVVVNSTPDKPIITTIDTTAFCMGDTILLSSESVAGLTYQWKKDGGNTGNNLNELNVSTEGSYALVVTNSSSCTAQSDAIGVTVYNNPSIPAIDKSGPTAFCQGGNVTLSVVSENQLNYQWKNQYGNMVGDTTNQIVVDATDNYQLQISNNNGCLVQTETVAVTVYESPSEPLVEVVGETEFCTGDSVVLQTEANTGLTYQWKKDEGNTGSNENKLNVSTQGSYSLIVTNSSLCSSQSDVITVTVYTKPSIPAIDKSGPTAFCQGGSVTLSVVSEDQVFYKWKDQFGTMSGETTNQILVDETGDYQLLLTNNQGCSVQTETVSVTVYDSPGVPLVEANGDTEFCAGDSVVLQTVSNAELTYQWKKDGGNTGSGLSELTAKTSGAYHLVATNSNECAAASNTVNVIVNSLPTKPSITQSGATTFCFGDSIKLSVENEEGMAYQWKNSLGNIAGATINELYVSTTEEYYLEMTNNSGCKAITDKVKVTVLPSPESPVVVAETDTVVCQGKVVSLTSPFNEAYTYQWRLNGKGLGEGSNEYNAQIAGAYTLEISNANGCNAISSNSIVVSHLENPDAPIVSLYGETNFCNGDSVRLNVEATEGYLYQWFRLPDKLSVRESSLNVKTSGYYSVQIQNASGCVSEMSDTVTVIVHSNPNSISISSDKPTNICEGETATLSVLEQAGCSYVWYNNNQEIVGALTHELQVAESGSYHTVATNENSCSQTAAAVGVSVFANPQEQTIHYEGSLNICRGSSVALSVNSQEGFTYQWLHNGVDIDDAEENTYSATDDGQFAVRIYNINNSECNSTTASVEIEFKPSLPQPMLYAEGSTSWILACDNPDAEIYKWYYNGNLIPDANEYTYVAGQDLGEYYVTVSDGGECHVPSNTVKIPYDPTGVTETETVFGTIKIYPNPTPGVFTIEMNNEIIGTLYIRIVSEQGKELFNIEHNKNTQEFKTQMDLSGQGDGIYFIEFRFEGNRAVRKVVVE